MNKASHIILEGITWELAAATRFALLKAIIVWWPAARFAGVAATASRSRRGADHGILSCDIYSLGRGGVVLAGGNRKTLSPGRHFVENCHIFDLFTH